MGRPRSDHSGRGPLTSFLFLLLLLLRPGPSPAPSSLPEEGGENPGPHWCGESAPCWPGPATGAAGLGPACFSRRPRPFSYGRGPGTTRTVGPTADAGGGLGTVRTVPLTSVSFQGIAGSDGLPGDKGEPVSVIVPAGSGDRAARRGAAAGGAGGQSRVGGAAGRFRGPSDLTGSLATAPRPAAARVTATLPFSPQGPSGPVGSKGEVSGCPAAG